MTVFMMLTKTILLVNTCNWISLELKCVYHVMTDNAMMRRSSIAAKDILILKKTKNNKNISIGKSSIEYSNTPYSFTKKFNLQTKVPSFWLYQLLLSIKIRNKPFIFIIFGVGILINLWIISVSKLRKIKQVTRPRGL